MIVAEMGHPGNTRAHNLLKYESFVRVVLFISCKVGVKYCLPAACSSLNVTLASAALIGIGSTCLHHKLGSVPAWASATHAKRARDSRLLLTVPPSVRQ